MIWMWVDVMYDTCICNDHNRILTLCHKCWLMFSLPCSTDVDIFGLNRQQSEMRDGLCLLMF